MIYKHTNGKILIIKDIEYIEKKNFNKDNSIPYIVLITAWDKDSYRRKNLNNLISSLIQKGTKNFICIGKYSELLHDQIDEIIYSYYFNNNISEAIDIITSFHENEVIEDVLNNYIFWIDMDSNKCQYLLALLNSRKKEDKKLLNTLEVVFSASSCILK